MSHPRSFAIGLVLLATPLALSQDMILLADGSAISGRLVKDDGASVVVRLSGTGGEARRTVRYSELHPRTLYRLMAGKAAAGDAPAQLAVGDAALRAEIFAAARKHYDLALKADPRLADRVTSAMRSVDEAAARSLAARAEAASRGGDLPEFERLLTSIVTEFPETPAAAEASPRLASARRAATAPPRTMTAASTNLRRALASAEKKHAESHEHVTRGLESAKSLRVAVAEYEEAIADLGAALSSVDAAVRGASLTQDETRDVEAVRSEFRADLVRAHLQLASLYSGRNSYVQALSWVDRAIAVDPADAMARRTRQRIELESALASSRNYRGR